MPCALCFLHILVKPISMVNTYEGGRICLSIPVFQLQTVERILIKFGMCVMSLSVNQTGVGFEVFAAVRVLECGLLNRCAV